MQNGPQRLREVFFRPDDGGYLHSVLASREAMSAVPRNLAAVWGEHFRRPSANQVGKLCRFGFRPQATKVSAKAASRPIAADVQASGLPHPLLSGRRTSRTSQHFRKPSAVWSSLA
jgi:hypothetical protein